MLQSTATDLGDIELRGNLTEAQQLAEVRRREQTWRDALPELEGRKVLLSGYHRICLEMTARL